MVTNVAIEQSYNLDVLDTVARDASANVLGASVNPNGSIVHLAASATVIEISLIETMLAQFGSLALSVDSAVIAADGVTEATITLNTADSSVNWLILDSAGAVVGSGTEASAGGVVTLEFSTSVPDVYEIWIYRNQGDYATGKVTVTATEV